MPQCGQPGVPQSNAAAECANREVLAGTRSLLLLAGLPHYFWEYAMRCYCFFDNVGRVDGEGESPWSRTHGTAFKGQLVPFGSKVYFISTTDRVKKQKYEDLAIAGVFAGYETTLGYGWSGIYLVWRLEDFAGMDLKQKSHVTARRQLIPYIARELGIAEEGIVYPLKAEYERGNRTWGVFATT